VDRLFGTSAQPFGRQLSRPGAGKLPVTVITGFLGAGKSTLIKALLASPEGAGTALIINEFGEVGIDDALLRESSEKTMLLGNGCLCCLSGTDLQLTLRDLFAERLRGAIPDFRRVIIETSGLADPSPILQTLATDRTLDVHYALEGLVTVVDTATALASVDHSPEWTKQVALADRIVLTKTDLATPEQLDQVRALLTELAPLAPVTEAAQGVADPAFVLGEGEARQEAQRRSAFLCEAPAVDPGAHRQPYKTFVITIDRPLPWSVFAHALDTLASLRGPDLLRVKGFVNVAGRAGPVVVHFVQHLAHQPEELTSWPSPDHRTRLVFITRQLTRERVEGLLAAVLAMAEDADENAHS
jgi:G3E family GTPase